MLARIELFVIFSHTIFCMIRNYHHAIPIVTWVGPRTENFCEPRQVRKEAAAAKYFRVANPSGSGGIFSFLSNHALNLSFCQAALNRINCFGWVKLFGAGFHAVHNLMATVKFKCIFKLV